jgi:hypothetical protein
VVYRRPRHRVVLRLVLAAFFVALVALPFAHHDLLCHLKSSTHCATCHIGTSTDDSGAQPPLAHIELPDAGRAIEVGLVAVVSCALCSSAGRSPPPASISIA